MTRMEMYTRKKTEREVGHGPKVVERLVEDLNGKGHTIYTDSFFTSVNLYDDLYSKGTNATGTICKDRLGLPTELRDCNLKKNEKTEFVRTVVMETNDGLIDGSLHAMKIHDKKVVTLISTETTSKAVDTGKKDRQNQTIHSPEMIHAYNKNMNTVDQFDQNIQS